MTTMLRRWHYVENPGKDHKTYTCDSWTIPDEGTGIWCTGWKHGQTIKPYGDGAHVVVGLSPYHCDELMGILRNWECGGETWGIEGVKMVREQLIAGQWRRVEVAA